MRRTLTLTVAITCAAGLAGLAVGLLSPASAASGGAPAAVRNVTIKTFTTHLPPLDTIGGVTISGGAYGSSLTRVPGTTNQFYGLTDRGPNVDGPNGTKVEPLPGFDPAIGKFRLSNGQAVLLRSIPLRANDGTPYSGRVNTLADTGETITDLDGNVLPKDPNGYDPEGLVALKDGTFWVSDEYGPFITHFGANGRAIGLSPYDATLPAELRLRVPNKGMEGLTVTPDGKTLVGIMQSALQTPDLVVKPAKVTTLRIASPSRSGHGRLTSSSTCSTTPVRRAPRSVRSPRCPTPTSSSTRGTATSSQARTRSSGASAWPARPTSAPAPRCRARRTTRPRVDCSSVARAWTRWWPTAAPPAR